MLRPSPSCLRLTRSRERLQKQDVASLGIPAEVSRPVKSLQASTSSTCYWRAESSTTRSHQSQLPSILVRADPAGAILNPVIIDGSPGAVKSFGLRQASVSTGEQGAEAQHKLPSRTSTPIVLGHCECSHPLLALQGHARDMRAVAGALNELIATWKLPYASALRPFMHGERCSPRRSAD